MKNSGANRVIDLFSGCGGLSWGFIKNDFEITKAVEFDEKIAVNYINNHPNVDLIIDDIRNIDNSGIFKKNDAEVIIGGPPCQGFSMAGARIRRGFIDDPRNYLFKHYFNIVKTVRPKVFVMENVKGLLTMQNGKIFDEIKSLFENKELLEGQNYNIYYRVVKANEYGIPQKRERVIIIGCLNSDINIETVWNDTISKVKKRIPDFFKQVSVYDAIGNLPTTTDDGIIENPKPNTKYQEYLSCKEKILYNHTRTGHSKVATERMSKVGVGENYEVLEDNIKSVHSGAYGRLEWDKPAQTITTRFDTPAGGRFIHPVENRTISPREAARIQSFPDDFVFYGNKTTICKTIGNAVPPKLSYFLGNLVREILDKKGD